MRRRPPAVALALGIVLALLAATPALAAGYRYWSFWDGSAGGQWSYATQGPSLARPADGAVQGFRFSVSKDAAAEAAKPRAAADFEAVCGATAPADGKKRVALVIDFGVPQDAPAGDAPPEAAPRTACAQVAPEATAAEALASVAKPLRYNSAALLCAISGYPKQGCGDQVADTSAGASAGASAEASAAPSGSAQEDDGGPSAGLLAGIAAVAALAAAGIWQSRRRGR
ncbi:SCO2322 family protein [Streptomyces sp. NPDC059979]|uniref:SCO2322 family protein n=2 Tax=unclassified Streptomyces TaxID=2593676 RepID=UPI00368A3E48